MRLLVFVTDDGVTPDATGPILFVREAPDAILPANPRGLDWRYFATILPNDPIMDDYRAAAEAAIEQHGYYVANRLIHNR
jgi:hypothetical protein